MKLPFVMLFTCVAMANPMPSSRSNEIENLFFMDEREERSLEENALRNVVIEKVKARILNSLQLKEAPKHHIPPPQLQDFENNSWTSKSQTNSTFHSGKSEFLQSEIVPNTCFDRGGHCLRFQINLKNLLERNTNTEIWLFKKKNVDKFQMSLIESGLIKHSFQILNQSNSDGWIRLDASVLLNSTSSSILDLEVSSETEVPLEIGMNKNPFLVIHQETRTKRSTGGCQQDSNICCVKNLYVSFSEIGWDSWIVQPEGYSANICKGSCKNRMDLAEKHHSTIMILMMGKKKEMNESVHCTPKVYKPLSIIYTDESGVKVISNLPNMSVSECSCS